MSVYRGSWAEILAHVTGGRPNGGDSAAAGSAPGGRPPTAGTGLSIYVLGGTDTGKTTLSHRLLGAADAAGSSVEGAAGGAGKEDAWYLDCDPGQSVLGPPTTVGLARFCRGARGGAGDPGSEPGAGETEGGPGPAEPEPGPAGAPRFETVALSFVGSTSPAQHPLQTLAGVARLVREVPASGLLVCDSSGFVSGRLAGEFQYNLVSLLRPDIVVALDADAELRRTLWPFHEAPDIEVLHMESDAACRSKSRAARADHRRRLFTRYFAGATQQWVELGERSLHGMVSDDRGTAAAPAVGTGTGTGIGTGMTAPAPGAAAAPTAYRNRLCALLDGRQLVVALGIILGVSGGRGARGRAIEELEVLAPPFGDKRIVSVQLGSHKLFPEDLTYQEPHE